MIRILVGAARRGRLDRYRKEIAAARPLTRLDDIEIAYEFNDSAEIWGSDIEDCDVLLIPTSRGFAGTGVARAKRLRFVQKLGASGGVDIAACKARGIAVSVLPHAGHIAVAEHTLMFILCSARQTLAGDAAVRRGDNPLGVEPMVTSKSRRHSNWLDVPRDSFAPVSGRTLGLIGFGDIAQEVSRRARAFGMRVVCAKRTPLSAEAEARFGVTHADLPTLLRTADFVSMHATQGEDDRPLIGRDELALMKPRAVLINTARGNQVDQAALIEALKAGRIAGACLDVFAVEPVQAGAFEGVPNVVLTPHTAGVVPWNTLYKDALVNIDAFFKGGEVAGLV